MSPKTPISHPVPHPRRHKVSIVLPTFNRAAFLSAAVDSICQQTFRDWNLIVIDDGSTDTTAEFLARLPALLQNDVVVRRQANRGAYAARNSGVELSTGAYIAFFDSDDLWLPHHLETCVAVLEEHPDVDWVYGACEIVDLTDGRVTAPSTFAVQGRPRPFMRLRSRPRGRAWLLSSEDAIRCQIRDGLFCGLQNSVLRRGIFDQLRFEADSRNEAEDQLFTIRALSAGFHLAYVEDVLVRYHIHSGNSSAAATSLSAEKRQRVFEALVAGYARLRNEVPLTPSARRALRKRLGRELFWHLGYATLWAAGDRAGALRAYRSALREWPWDIRQWKTCASALVRSAVSGAEARGKASSS